MRSKALTISSLLKLIKKAIWNVARGEPKAGDTEFVEILRKMGWQGDTSFCVRPDSDFAGLVTPFTFGSDSLAEEMQFQVPEIVSLLHQSITLAEIDGKMDPELKNHVACYFGKASANRHKVKAGSLLNQGNRNPTYNLDYTQDYSEVVEEYMNTKHALVDIAKLKQSGEMRDYGMIVVHGNASDIGEEPDIESFLPVDLHARMYYRRYWTKKGNARSATSIGKV